MKERNKKIKFVMFLIIGVLLISFGSSYMRSNPKYTQISSRGAFGSFNKSMCDAGQDFIIQIAPFGCTPAVVRSDLLEEQNVPVFCRLGATKINPLIEVEAIEGISFSGKYPKEVSGIGFHPVSAALGADGNLNSPILNNIGYAVIVLKKQKNASAMPEFVEGNLTAKIRYDIKNAFGIGKADFYLPEMSDKDWEDKHVQYGFWDGRGYVRAEGIDEDGTTISIYDDVRKISSVNLKKGETSGKIYIPGFDCLAGLQLKLNGLEAPDTRAKLRVNADVVEVKDGEKFLENQCRITNIDKQGLVQEVSINCKEDEGRKNFELSISPKVELEIDGVEKREFVVGDKLYKDGNRNVFLGYIGKSEKRIYIIPVISKASDKEQFLNSIDYGFVKTYVKIIEDKSSGVNIAKRAGVFAVNMVNAIARGSDFGSRIFEGDVVKVNFLFDNIGKKGLSSVATGGAAGVVATMFFTGPLGAVAVGAVAMSLIATGTSIADSFETEKVIEFVGFAGAYDRELEGDAKIYYDKAIKDYGIIVHSFSGEKENEETEKTFGERALFEKIKLANDLEQKRTMVEFCEEFKNEYSKSKHMGALYNEGNGICDNKLKISSSEISNRDVLINGRVKRISFDGVYEPSFKEYGVEVTIRHTKDADGIYELRKSENIHIEDESLYLKDLDYDFAVFDAGNVNYGGLSGGSSLLKVELKECKLIGKKGYEICLNKINLKKSAKVSVIPSIDNAGTEASFSFKIGIEKRAIELSPEKTRKKIKELDETIKEWEEKSESLGSIVKGLKTACLGTGALLTVKNFFANIGGKAIARQNVMRGDGGWYERCADLVNDGKYHSQETCMVGESKNIEKDVDKWHDIMEEQNNRIKELQEGITETSAFGERVVDDDKFMKKYSSGVQKYLEDNFGEKFENPDGSGEFIDMDEMRTTLSYDGWKNNGNYDKEQLRDIELYLKILKSNPDDIMAKTRLYSVFSDVKINSENYAERSDWASGLGISSNQIGFLETGKNARQLPYDGLENKDLEKKGIENIGDNVPVQLLQTSQGKKYIIVLDDSAVGILPIKKVYDSDGIEVPEIPSELESVYFRKYDKTSYQNEFKSSVGDAGPVVKYYETEPYKGLPAIVPFDLKNGWYVATKQTLPIMGNIKAFDASGRVSGFWLCNVGKNGREEFNSGNDICQMINTGTGQPYNQFSGLEEGEAIKRIRAGVKAIEQASRQYKSGVKKVNINVGYGNLNLKVGNPAADIPDMQCQDFMSPKECQLLFNVCDPVICPSSRCDFGGAYPVKDVIQSGIIGSLVLCLPNFREGIYIPVCLTGIKAGIDGLLSVYGSYRDCLQESLDTGAMVGVCDEIYSIYMCEFLWKQALPLADVIIPKMMEIILGQNVHGGGEYLGVASAWSNAGKSVTYFTQYYAANSFKAFKARSTEEVGGEVCKSFISGVYPEGGNLLDSLTEPDSPPQFHGRFDEIPFTSTTVPPISQYKVFYHIFSGKDSGAYYKVYLRGDAGSSFYQDTSNRRIIASGYIATGGYATETKDFTAPSGYKELCISVDNQEECGFKEVSTSFAVNYVKDQYLASQAKEMDVKTEKECISGTASVYSLLTPNLQAGAEEAIDPAIYKRGIIRICATDNPGKGTDVYSGTENSRWKEVGYCGDKKIKCWLDSESVKDVIKNTDIEKDVLEKQSENYLDMLMNEGDYVEDFDRLLKEIRDLSNKEKINKINEFFEKVFFNHQKANLLWLRGNAYGELAKGLYKEIKARATQMTSGTGVVVSKDYSSIVFEFKDGTLAKNIFYRYYNGKWEWSPYKDSWMTGYRDEPSKKNQEIIKLLENKNFEQGLELLVERTIRDKGGFISFGAELVIENGNVSFSSKEVFSVRQKDRGFIYFRYGLNKWWWNQEIGALSFYTDFSENIKNGWTACPEIVVKGGPRKGQESAEENKKLISALENKDLSGGAVIIFTQGKEGIESEIGEGSKYSEDECDHSIGGCKIWEIAKGFVEEGHDTGRLLSGGDVDKSYVCARFVTEVLIDTNTISGFELPPNDYCPLDSVESMLKILGGRNDFVEIQDTENFKKGDLVAFAWYENSKRTGQHITIFDHYDMENILHLYVFGEGGTDRPAIKQDYTLGPNVKILEAYEYIGGDPEFSRTKWTLDSAFEKVGTLRGKYSDNKVFVDQIYEDGILTEKEYIEIKGEGENWFKDTFNLEEDMSELKKLLLGKQASSGQEESTKTD